MCEPQYEDDTVMVMDACSNTGNTVGWYKINEHFVNNIIFNGNYNQGITVNGDLADDFWEGEWYAQTNYSDMFSKFFNE